MRKIAVFITVLTMLWLSTAASASEQVRISEAEKEYLARAIAVSYPEISYGGRVAVAAAVLNRMKSAGYPDSAGGAVMSFAAEGEFEGAGKTAARIGEDVLRLSRDAVEAAVSGADPTDGAVCFERVRGKRKADLKFDDTAEDERLRETERYLKEKYGKPAKVIDGMGFGGGMSSQ